MKITDIVQMKPLGVREDEAERLIGIAYLFTKMLRAGWIKPIVHRNKEKLFSVEDVERCFLLLRNGEHPDTKPAVCAKFQNDLTLRAS